MFVSLNPPYSISFDVDSNVLEAALIDSDLEREQFKSAALQIGDMLLARLSHTTDEYVHNAARENQEVEQTNLEEQEGILRSKMESVGKVLYNNGLQQRYDLKRTSKSPSFSDIDWDVKVKYVDAKWQFSPFPYATCRISFQKEFGESPWAIIGGRAFDSVQLNFSSSELDYLLKVFGAIKERLLELEANLAEGNVTVENPGLGREVWDATW